jgi:hypothetical protein
LRDLKGFTDGLKGMLKIDTGLEFSEIQPVSFWGTCVVLLTFVWARIAPAECELTAMLLTAMLQVNSRTHRPQKLNA